MWGNNKKNDKTNSIHNGTGNKNTNPGSCPILFDENYKGEKMYDASYQLGVEATAVQVDHCIFKAYTTANYYLNGHTDDCSKENVQKITYDCR